MMADDLDGKTVDDKDVEEANNQILLLAKSIVAASPKDHRGDPIAQQLTLPKNTFVSGQTLTIRLDGNLWRLTYRQGHFYAWRNGVEQEVRYDTKTTRWQEADTPALPVAQARDRGYDGQQRIIRQG